ncbi:hypothetical protein CPT_Percy1 [Caulobacter phage Percy]|uniref:Uncharacterized protein n=1 Tax=Caulobacter phage Percy TaxID=1701809 RepID=A0A0M4RBT3_9CAUD|nr:hypothetical protein CPT_Percy1 [Caulobacter phage Percy]ALF01635.1 hypothetical protein CPT_Percy1 [Caulobacter phage Percy]
MAKRTTTPSDTAPKTTSGGKGYQQYLQGSAAALDKAIISIGQRSKTLDLDIHNAAVGCIGRSLPHDNGGHLDAERARKLVAALSAGQSRLRVVAWFHHFSNIRLTATTDAKTGALTVKVRLLKPEHDEYKADIDLTKAHDTPFWKLNAEASVEVKQFDSAALSRYLNNLVKAYAKAKEEGHVSLTPVEEKLVEGMVKTAKTQADRAAQVAKQAGAAVMKVAAEKHVDPLTVIENVRKTA